MPGVARLIVMCERPPHLARDEVRCWLRHEATAVARQESIESVALTELDNMPIRWDRLWDWLIEIELDDASAADFLAKGSVCAGLVADLRLLGMRPALAVADPAKKQALSRRADG